MRAGPRGSLTPTRGHQHSLERDHRSSASLAIYPLCLEARGRKQVRAPSPRACPQAAAHVSASQNGARGRPRARPPLDGPAPARP